MATTDIFFDPKDPGEDYAISFNFADSVSTITAIDSAVITVEVAAGTDETPEAILDGPLAIDALLPVVMQRIAGGVNGCLYRLRCAATGATGTIVSIGYLLVSTAR